MTYVFIFISVFAGLIASGQAGQPPSVLQVKASNINKFASLEIPALPSLSLPNSFNFHEIAKAYSYRVDTLGKFMEKETELANRIWGKYSNCEAVPDSGIVVIDGQEFSLSKANQKINWGNLEVKANFSIRIEHKPKLDYPNSNEYLIRYVERSCDDGSFVIGNTYKNDIYGNNIINETCMVLFNDKTKTLWGYDAFGDQLCFGGYPSIDRFDLKDPAHFSFSTQISAFESNPTKFFDKWDVVAIHFKADLRKNHYKALADGIFVDSWGPQPVVKENIEAGVVDCYPSDSQYCLEEITIKNMLPSKDDHYHPNRYNSRKKWSVVGAYCTWADC